MSPHGTPARYRRGKCRCEECRIAAADYHRYLRNLHRHRGTIPADAKHGTIHCYKYYGCTCDLCRAANTERVRRQREAKR